MGRKRKQMAKEPELKKKKIKKKVSDLLELPKEVVLDLPVMSMIGNEELHIENYKGIIEYNEERIRINTASGVLKLEGRGLFLKILTTEDVTITGTILHMEFLV